MSNSPNMNYCMCENTERALNQVIDSMKEALDGGPEKVMDFLNLMHMNELEAYRRLFSVCETFMQLADEIEQIEGVVAQEEFDDLMDGDAASALASTGFGTDEDYGYYGD